MLGSVFFTLIADWKNSQVVGVSELSYLCIQESVVKLQILEKEKENTHFVVVEEKVKVKMCFVMVEEKVKVKIHFVTVKEKGKENSLLAVEAELNSHGIQSNNWGS